MEWLTSNLLPLTIATGIASIITIRLWWKSKPSKLGIGISLIGLALLGVGGYTVVTSTPGGIDVVDEDPTDGNQNPDAPDSAIETLLASWDSEAAADWPAAETLARISECVYDSPVDAERSFTDLGLSRVTTVTSGTMLGYVASGDDVTVIPFRGSEKELGDWLANFDRSPLPVDKGTIHGGFWNAYLSLKPQIEKCLAGRQTEHLWVTGHSLGGALALCCSYDQILNENREIDGLVTFGQPMVARTDLVEYLDDVLLGRYARFANKRDVVLFRMIGDLRKDVFCVVPLIFRSAAA